MFLNAETAELDYIRIKHSADQNDEKLLLLLYDDEELRKKFFTKVKDIYVFNTNNFKFFIDENKIDNSYTQLANRIGLHDGSEFLKNRNEVVIYFPFKDCVLQGGQSTEEGMDTYFEYEEEKTKTVRGERVTESSGYKVKTTKRKEVFFNSVLAHDEIDRLFDLKALVNWKKFTKYGVHSLSMKGQTDGGGEVLLKRDKDGTIKENLIIKGNNLLALHSLKKQFSEKVKLIYIDPPYNTGNDSFKYNNKFNHSTWLTFMKNRLEVARELLRDDGVIFVQCDDNEQAYLKVLMDEIFGRDKTDYMVWQKTDPRYDQNTNSKIIRRFKRVHEHIVIAYKSDKNNYLFNKIKRLPEWKNKYTNPDNDPRGAYKQGIISYKEGHQNENKKSENYYSVTLPSGRKITRHFFISNEEFEKLKKERRIYFPNKGDGIPAVKIFENEEKDFYCDSILRGFGTSSIAKKELELLQIKIDDFDTPKPEKLICEIIRMSTQPGDLILDFFIGSGTTAAVAHKMGRQYIGIEQMNYIEGVAVERLKKVIDGEQGGISSSVNFLEGGGASSTLNSPNGMN